MEEGDVSGGAICLEDNVIYANGTNRAGSDCAVDAGNPNDLVSILGIKQSVSHGAAPSQGDGGRLLFGFKHLRQLESEAARNLDEIGVSKWVHNTDDKC